MLVSPVNTNYNTSFNGLVPLKNYKGAVLKLTKEDRAQIAEYEKQIAELDIEVSKLDMLVQKYFRKPISEIYATKAWCLRVDIEELLAKIRNVKINRFNIQKQNGNI